MLIYIAAALFFVYLAARRRMGSDRIHPLSKVQGDRRHARRFRFSAWGASGSRSRTTCLQVVALYFLVGTSIFTIVMVTPTQAEYVKGLLRARKQGLSHLPSWDDLSLNRVFLAIRVRDPARDRHGHLASGHRRARGAAGRRGEQLSAGSRDERAGRRLFRPGDAVLPAPVRTAREDVLRALSLSGLGPADGGRDDLLFASMPRDTSQVGQIIYSLSPIAGIATSSVGGDESNFLPKSMQGAAITPALFFAFVFNSLLIAARRRLHRDFLARADRQGIRGRRVKSTVTCARRGIESCLDEIRRSRLTGPRPGLAFRERSAPVV